MLTTETKVLGGIGIATVLILVLGAFFLSKPVSTDLSSAPTVNENILVNSESMQTGPKDAKVRFVEFGDFQCPACASAHPVVNQLREEYKDKVNFIYRHYPLPQHKNAMIAALAAEAAGEQNKFWEMADKLYENQAEWAESNKPKDSFMKYAGELSLNIQLFKKTLDTEKFKNRVNKGQSDGAAAQIRYTPTFFINGRKIEGSFSYDVLKSGVESELNK